MNTKMQSLGKLIRGFYGKRFRVRAGWVQEINNVRGKWVWNNLTTVDAAPQMFPSLFK